jgi:hypothetical protein
MLKLIQKSKTLSNFWKAPVALGTGSRTKFFGRCLIRNGIIKYGSAALLKKASTYLPPVSLFDVV